MTKPQLTIFTVPTSFKGYAEVAQYNAIKSWSWAAPNSELLFISPNEEAAGVAAQFGAKCIGDIECDDSGKPLLNDVFRAARQHGNGKHFLFVSPDIIFTRKLDFLMPLLENKTTALSGNAHPIVILRPLNFDRDDWQGPVIDEIEKSDAADHSGSFYLMFSPNLFETIPAVPADLRILDSIFLVQSLRAGATIIDTTRALKTGYQFAELFPKSDKIKLDSTKEAWGKMDFEYQSALLKTVDPKHLGLFLADSVLSEDGTCFLPPSRNTQEQRLYRMMLPLCCTYLDRARRLFGRGMLQFRIRLYSIQSHWLFGK